MNLNSNPTNKLLYINEECLHLITHIFISISFSEYLKHLGHKVPCLHMTGLDTLCEIFILPNKEGGLV